MDWNLKAASSDLSEFVEEAMESNTDAINGSKSCKVPRSTGDFSVDLKLGQVGNSGQESLNKRKEPAKRARAISNGSHQAFCLVDECNLDLGNCRDYYRRHKVCELHSKTAQVMVNGQMQRFCQQCSRFHKLEEFDEAKRSCRKRLDGHNRRRRKSQADPGSRSGRFFSNYQGSQMLPSSSLHEYPSTTVVKPAWPGVTNSETESRHLNQQQQLHSSERQNLVLGSSSSNYRGGKQFAFFQGENKALQNQMPPEASVWQPRPRAVPFSEGSGVRDSVFCDRLTNPAQDSDCALSLLSSTQAQWDQF